MRWNFAIATVFCTTLASILPGLSNRVQAQSVSPYPIDLQTIPEAFEQEFTDRSQDTFTTAFTIGRQFDFLFGIGGFPEMEITGDAHDVERFYRLVLDRQQATGPILRTPDLPSPFNSSLRGNPVYTQPTQPMPGGEFSNW